MAAFGIEKDFVVCFYCMKNVSKLTAEKNKEPAYTSDGFKNWKKEPECFKDHQNSNLGNYLLRRNWTCIKSEMILYQRMMNVTTNLDDFYLS